MALNTSGPISLGGSIRGQSIELELGGNGSTTISLGDPAVRTLLGYPATGPVSMVPMAVPVIVSHRFLNGATINKYSIN